MDQEADAITVMRPGAADRAAENRRAVNDGGKPTHEIEEDIARTRVRLSATIEALERELAPARVIAKSTEVLRSTIEPGPGPFREQVWAYSVPLALIVTGLGWLFVLRQRSYRADLPSGFGEARVDAVEAGEIPIPAPRYANVLDPVEPLSLVDEKPAI